MNINIVIVELHILELHIQTPKINSSICRHEQLFDHTPLLVLEFSIMLSYLNISVIHTPLSPNMFNN